jgi:ribosomal protein S3AE
MAQAKRKKRFFDVEIPLIKKETQLQAFELEELEGRIIKYDLTRLLRGKGLILQAVVNVSGEKAIATPKKIILLPYFLRRMIRKGTNYVEDSFSAECKDAIIRIKPFLITRRKVSRRVRKALREKARQEIIRYAKAKNYEDIFDDILKNSLQKPLSLALKKIYPLSLCEIRMMYIEKMLEIKEEKTKEDIKKKSASSEIKEE